MKISFCTTCMNRGDHLKATLVENVADNKDCDGLEFVVVDYNSKDGVEAWVRDTMGDHIRSGRVRFVAERRAPWFERTHAKNIAHLAATGDVLVNIDADNFTGPGYAAYVATVFSEGHPVVLTTSWTVKDTTGKIGLTASLFRNLRGYDESLKGYGYEDVDLVQRAEFSGFRRVAMDWPGQRTIRHGHKARSQNLQPGVSHFVSHNENKGVVLTRGRGVVVNGDGYGKTEVFVNFSDRPTNVGVGGIA